MISVIIPVLNESDTISSVVEFARRSPSVDEVIVVDDGSIDRTPELAAAAGASVFTSTLLGKGASMEDGMLAARNQVILYLDGDLTHLHEELIERMTKPILDGHADFVKAKFSRQGGRVTALTARPLLRTFLPELADFQQPLAGVIAARRSLLRQLRFENDYGVDIGLLIDADVLGGRLLEVDVGHIEHDSQPLESLGEMATQVIRAVLDRAGRYGRLRSAFIRDVKDKEFHNNELSTILTNDERGGRLALFNMDGVLLQGRFIAELAQRTNKTAQLARLLDNQEVEPAERIFQIASLFAGESRDIFEQTARDIPLMPGARETVLALRKAGYRVGIVTDCYSVAGEIIRRRVFADFSVAHFMEFSLGKATGQVRIGAEMVHPNGCPHHVPCKVNTLLHLAERLAIAPDQVLVVGDGENDICLLQATRQSVAFHPKSPRVMAAARFVANGDLLEVCALAAGEQMQGAAGETVLRASA